MQLVLDTKGLTLAKKNGIFHVYHEKGERLISPGKLTSIAITANIRLEVEAISLALLHQIPIYFFDRIGQVKGRLWSPYFENIATLRRQQVQFATHPEATNWMLDLFHLKTQAQIDHLKFLATRKNKISLTISPTVVQMRKMNNKFDNFRGQYLQEVQATLMGIEGTIARAYWEQVGRLLPRNFHFTKRSRRPAKDPYNAGINYLYGMLYSVVESGIFAAGLDPHLGILHTDVYNKATLSFDLIEPFRPWIDQLLSEQCFEKHFKKTFCTSNQFGLFLNREGKGFIIPLFNAFLRTEREYLGQNSTVRNHIYALCSRLVQRIRATIDA